MRKTLVALALACAGAPGALSAQGAAPAADPVITAARQIVQRYSSNLVGAAEAMPAEKWEFKPTEQQMTYGALMGHVAMSNDFLCGSIAGQPPAGGEEGGSMTKEQTVEALKKSFEACDAVLARTSDSSLGGMVSFFGGSQVTRAMAVLALTGDLMDHYATAANYLRLNGILPPSAKPR